MLGKTSKGVKEMKKKYLKTVEDVLALKDTDTKIYRDGVEGYYQFVKDTLVEFSPYNAEFWRLYPSFDIGDEPYILEEEPQETTKEDVGKLCWFWDDVESIRKVGVLTEINCRSRFVLNSSFNYINCRPLTKEEIKEFMEKA